MNQFFGVRKIASRSGSGFGLGLALELGLGGAIFLRGNFLEPNFFAKHKLINFELLITYFLPVNNLSVNDLNLIKESTQKKLLISVLELF